MYKLLVIFFFTCASIQLQAQVNFINPSLEDSLTGPLKAPKNWTLCEGSPDLLPIQGFSHLIASDSSTYSGLSAFQQAFEGIGQSLQATLIKDSAYCFSIDIAYMPNRLSGGGMGRLSIYLGDSSCNYDQLIYTSGTIDTVWNSYTVRFTADDDYDYVTIRSVAIPPDGGYVYFDNLSDYGCDTTMVRVVEEREPITNAMKAFPNPTFDILTIQWEVKNANHLVVYNNLGQLVDYITLKEGLNQHVLDVSKYSAGLYHIQLKTADAKLHTNFIVKR